MEGRLISVASVVTLPAQPTVGTVRYIPLGGDGFSAPIAAYAIAGHAVTGDAGGGNASMRIIMDNRYTSLVSWCTMANIQVASADADFRIILFGPGVPTQVDAGVITAISATVQPTTISRQWNPTPTILAGGDAVASISFIMLNVNLDVLDLSALIYLFDLRARELTPMGPLLWARGST